MYEIFYNLKLDPFSPNPNHQFCYWHHSYKQALSSLRGILYAPENAVMIIGKAGTGKTTLVNHLIGSLNPQQIKVANISPTQSYTGNIVHQAAKGFCLDPKGLAKVAVLNNLSKTLQHYSRTNSHALLIIDDAHYLTNSALQDLRSLASMHANQRPLLHIFMFGPESLGNRVIAMGMEQANQRSLITLCLEPLNAADARQYILHRLSKVGWDNNPHIDARVFPLVHAVSRGIPRLINRVCSRLLRYGSEKKLTTLQEKDIRHVINQLHQEYLDNKKHHLNTNALQPGTLPESINDHKNNTIPSDHAFKTLHSS